jgi:hypothetical protein
VGFGQAGVDFQGFGEVRQGPQELPLVEMGDAPVIQGAGKMGFDLDGPVEIGDGAIISFDL